jgi:ubiquinone/menaquinone biosynthesis C-methylase UbiE
MMQPGDELGRIRTEYARRSSDAHLSDRYTAFDLANLFAIQSRERALIDLLCAEGRARLSNFRLLDLGCGTGGELRRFLGYGAGPTNLYGLDLLSERLAIAHQLSPHLGFVQGDAGHLPFADAMFDLVFQFTVFSSILDPVLKHRMASEMVRVLKADGLIVWYDFWLNPTNKQTRGIRPAEVRRLFAHCAIGFHRVTLAPPITRKLVRTSWLMCYLLEKMRVFNTHYLAAIRPLGVRRD